MPVVVRRSDLNHRGLLASPEAALSIIQRKSLAQFHGMQSETADYATERRMTDFSTQNFAGIRGEQTFQTIRFGDLMSALHLVAKPVDQIKWEELEPIQKAWVLKEDLFDVQVIPRMSVDEVLDLFMAVSKYDLSEDYESLSAKLINSLCASQVFSLCLSTLGTKHWPEFFAGINSYGIYANILPRLMDQMLAHERAGEFVTSIPVGAYVDFDRHLSRDGRLIAFWQNLTFEQKEAFYNKCSGIAQRLGQLRPQLSDRGKRELFRIEAKAKGIPIVLQ